VDANYVNVYGHDITERKRVEDKLRESEERFRQFFENEPEYCYMISPEAVILDVNKAALEALGYEKSRLVGQPLEVIYAPESQPKMKQLVKKWRKTGTLRNEEIVIVTKKGDRRIVLLSADVVRDKDGKVLHSVSVQRDITERKKAEDKLLEDQAKLKAMASEMLLTEEHERQRLAVGLHDSVCQKLVLTKLALESSLNLVSDSKVLASLRIVCEGIGETIEQADSLTFELSNPVLREFGFVVALEKYLTEEIRQKHGIVFELQSDEQLSTLPDEIKNCLFRVTRELLTNVVKHAQAHKIKVSVRKSQSQIYVRVQDDGVGFKESQVSATVSKTTRFGLFSIREQLEYLGGHLEIESEPGQGTTATIVVPLRDKATV
jgi:PAS domain S-box-containing protein